MEERIEKAQPLYAQAYLRLKRDVMEGRFRPGERLTDSYLAAQLGISRTPVREAIRQLVREGLLVSEPNRGVTVFYPQPEDVAEIYAFRATLEGMATALAALNQNSRPTLDEMERMIVESEEAAGVGDTSTVTANNMSFHDAIITLSGSSRMRDLLEPLRVRSFRMRYESLSNPEHVRTSLVEHRLILDLLRRRDAAEAEAMVRKHILLAGSRAVAQMSAGGPSTIFQFYRDYVPAFLRQK